MIQALHDLIMVANTLNSGGAWVIWLSLLLLAFHVLPSRPYCYYPNGDRTTLDFPCSDGSEESACCGNGHACLSNGLCMKTEIVDSPDGYQFARGSCTDANWRSPNCPLFCANTGGMYRVCDLNTCLAGASVYADRRVPDVLDGGQGVVKCEKSGVDSYCCGGEDCDCESGHNTISFNGIPSILTTIGVTSTSATSTSPSSISATTFDATSSPDRNPQSTQTNQSPPVAESTGDSITPTSNSSPSNTGLKIGLGVGISLGIIVVALGCYIIWRKLRQRRNAPDPAWQSTEYPVQEKIGGEPPPTYHMVPQELAEDPEPKELSATTDPKP